LESSLTTHQLSEELDQQRGSRHRYERKSLLVTSNQPFRKWDEIFPSGSMTVAAVDRLVHHCHIVGIKGDSYRQKAAAAGFLAMQSTNLRN
jgi:DNA replication protein DnaC